MEINQPTDEVDLSGYLKLDQTTPQNIFNTGMPGQAVEFMNGNVAINVINTDRTVILGKQGDYAGYFADPSNGVYLANGTYAIDAFGAGHFLQGYGSTTGDLYLADPNQGLIYASCSSGNAIKAYNSTSGADLTLADNLYVISANGSSKFLQGAYNDTVTILDEVDNNYGFSSVLGYGSGRSSAGYFSDFASNSVYLANGNYAINAYGQSTMQAKDSGYTTLDLYSSDGNNQAFLAGNGYGGYFQNSNGKDVTLAGNIFAIAATGDSVFVGDSIFRGSVDIMGHDGANTLQSVIVAGGAGGGGLTGGGGGAGGVINNISHKLADGTYNVVVGTGGSGSASGKGNNGNNSSFASFTAIGGGTGGINVDYTGNSGGSGGGGSFGATGNGGSGTAGQGYAGGNGKILYTCGGGGGAGAVGQNAVSSLLAGAGGIGIVNPIVGSTSGQNVSGTYYLAGGGGGGQGNYAGGSPVSGAGGYGGGAAGGNNAGTANTGGGGGGGNQNGTSGAGGSGIVIIKFLTSSATASATGTYAVTTSGSYKIYTFTGNGTFTIATAVTPSYSYYDNTFKGNNNQAVSNTYMLPPAVSTMTGYALVSDTLGNLSWTMPGLAINNIWTEQQIFYAKDATTVPIISRGFAAQTADLQQWQNASGTVKAKIDPTGNIIAVADGSSVILGTIGGGYSGLWFNVAVASINSSNYTFLSNAGAQTYINSASTSGIQFRQSNSTVLTTGAAGVAIFNTSDAATPTTQAFSVLNNLATKIGEVIKGYTSQSADLTQWQKSDATVLAKVDATGSAQFAGLTLSYVAVTGTYAVLATDYTINCTANTFTVTLPTAVGITGKIYNIKNSGIGTITVATTSSQTIDGLTTQIVLTGNNMQVQSNGTNWIII